ncbi:MAG: alternative ribosome rescue aminoacyl-tRNA hydrolase ArfB [Spirochaetia bacterium]
MTRRDLITDIRKVSRQEFSRSGGPGGQNVNKVNTQVTLHVSIDLLALPADESDRVRRRLANRCNDAGELVIQVSDTRSQHSNREIAVERAAELIATALRRPKRRRPTRPTAAARERRLSGKRRRSRIKQNRRIADDD